MHGSFETLVLFHEMYSFHDKEIEHKLRRHRGSLDWRRRFPGFDKAEWDRIEKDLQSKLQSYCCEWVETLGVRSLSIPIGLFKKTMAHLDTYRIDCTVRSEPCPSSEHRPLTGKMIPLRPPQVLAIEAAIKNEGGLIRMATGVGKTTVGQEIIRHYGLSAIFLVPSKPILMQTIDRFEYAFGRKNVGMFGAGKKKHSFVTVATYQSVFNANPEDFKDYRVMIGDEIAHIGADTFFSCAQNRLTHAVHRFGLTADEERGDGGTILVEAAVGPLIYAYECPEAIRDGYLAIPTFIIYEVFTTAGRFIKWKIKDKKRIATDILQSEAFTGDDAHLAYKNWVLGNDLLTEKIAQIIQAFEDDGKNVLVLIDEKEHGDKFIRLLPNAVLVVGGGSDNERTLQNFNARKLKVIVATSTLGEGADTVTVDVLVNLMGGTRPKQANGRALRNDPDENGIPRKPTCLIVDFDFPNSPVLNRHSIMRENVHRSCGHVHRTPLL